jgi:hypothetical protein
MENKKQGFIEIAVLFMTALGFFSGIAAYVVRSNQGSVLKVDAESFEECKAQGNPIMESYPERCTTIGGKTFTKEIDEKIDHAKITNFEECSKAGYPSTRSYPGKCITPDGRTFIQEIK